MDDRAMVRQLVWIGELLRKAEGEQDNHYTLQAIHTHLQDIAQLAGVAVAYHDQDYACAQKWAAMKSKP